MGDKTRYCSLIIMGLLSLSTQVVLAGTQGAVKPTKLYQPLATFTIGPDFVNPGQAQTLTILPPFQNTYTEEQASQTVADAGAFVGLERKFNDKLSIQLGVSGYVDAQITPKGSVWQFTLPEFEDLSYAYHIHHTRVMATTKLLTTISLYPMLHGEFIEAPPKCLVLI